MCYVAEFQIAGNYCIVCGFVVVDFAGFVVFFPS